MTRQLVQQALFRKNLLQTLQLLQVFLEPLHKLLSMLQSTFSVLKFRNYFEQETALLLGQVRFKTR